MQLPKDFQDSTHELMGDELYTQLVEGLEQTPPVSIRLNPFKAKSISSLDNDIFKGIDFSPVPWCKDGFYLSERPNFTADPLLHAGAYYVQEASSMFIDFALRQLVTKPVTMLDLCAAPGGKTTCVRAALPEGSLLYSNEPIRMRANILAENVLKFGHPDVIVTNNYAEDYAKAGLKFDVILTDVPCSGEGMFRKDHNAINEWSQANVESCWKLQRSIVEDIWQCLKPGGILIYSTCTFNAKEDEDNVEWIIENLGAKPVEIDGVRSEWNITGALKGDLPVYRFLPGRTKGEGLFMAVLRKNGNEVEAGSQSKSESTSRGKDESASRSKSESASRSKSGRRKSNLRVLCHGIGEGQAKGKKIIPDVSLALSIDKEKNNYPIADVDYKTAIAYLRREAINLPTDTPRGIVTISYKGFPLGFANNLGTRANNLYPQEWRIKTTHI